MMLAPSPDVHGPVGKHTRYLVAALADRGCAVTIATWGRTSDQAGPLARGVQRIGDVAAVHRTLTEGRFDVLVVKTAHDWSTLTRDLLLFRACRGGPPIVVQFHGSVPTRLGARGSRLFTAASRRLASAADGILVLSSDEQSGWRRVAGSVPVEVVRNPYLHRPDADEERSPSRDFVRLLFVGRLIPEKGAARLLEAAGGLAPHDVEVVIVGEGPQRGDLERLAAQLGVRARFPGYLDRSSMAEEYRSADVFVLPTTWDEGFPTVISEAMDFGLPIVTTRIRGMADHLVHGDNGFLVTPERPDELVAALRRLMVNSELRTAMGAANREAVRRFEPSVVAAEYLETINRILAQR